MEMMASSLETVEKTTFQEFARPPARTYTQLHIMIRLRDGFIMLDAFWHSIRFFVANKNVDTTPPNPTRTADGGRDIAPKADHGGTSASAANTKAATCGKFARNVNIGPPGRDHKSTVPEKKRKRRPDDLWPSSSSNTAGGLMKKLKKKKVQLPVHRGTTSAAKYSRSGRPCLTVRESTRSASSGIAGPSCTGLHSSLQGLFGEGLWM
ncbi:hypothetical protein ACOSQ3_016971 [Xanthoceras sorbifolium]